MLGNTSIGGCVVMFFFFKLISASIICIHGKEACPLHL